MLEELLPLIRGRADIEYRDIDSRPEWTAKYRVRIPVVEFEGRLISGYPLDHSAVIAVLCQKAENSD